MSAIDWYERRDELEEGMAFRTQSGNIVRLNRRMPADGSDWYADSWAPSRIPQEHGVWLAYDERIHPGDLVERLKEMES